MSISFDEVQKREEEAGRLSDLQIWYSVISKFVMFQDMPPEMRVDMILQTMGGQEDMIEMVTELLKEYLSDDEIDNNLVNEAIEEFKKRGIKV